MVRSRMRQEGYVPVVFEKLQALLGSNVTIDTVLSDTNVAPGGTLRGEIHFNGIERSHYVQRLGIDFSATVDADTDKQNQLYFHNVDVRTDFQLEAGVPLTVPFTVDIPWETPITSLMGRELPGMKLGVVTKLALRHALDASDLDPLVVAPLPVHLRVFKTLDELGFIFHSARLRSGSLPGSRMPFFQEIGYWSAGEYGMAFKALDLTLISSQAMTLVVIETDRKTMPNPDSDRCFSFTIGNDDSTDIRPILTQRLKQLIEAQTVLAAGRLH